jgi:hypothetical protein
MLKSDSSSLMSAQNRLCSTGISKEHSAHREQQDVRLFTTETQKTGAKLCSVCTEKETFGKQVI